MLLPKMNRHKGLAAQEKSTLLESGAADKFRIFFRDAIHANVRENFAFLFQRPWMSLALLVLGAAGAYALTRAALGPKIPVHTVARADIVQTVVASGRVEAPLRVEIGSQITGTVAAVPVAEGQFVKVRQLLVRLDDSATKAQVEQARSAVLQAETRLSQLRETDLPLAEQSLRQAEADLRNAQLQFDRNKELHARGLIARAELDDAEHAFEVAESKVQSAELQALGNSAAGPNYRIAEAALKQAVANLRAAEAALDYTTIKAPAAGTLISRGVERGNVVQPGKVLMVLSPAGETQLVVQIDEKSFGLLALGQKARASADAYPSQTFTAELAYINPGVDATRGSVEIKLRVPSPPDYLLQDMTVSVDIEVARRPNALILPAEAIHDAAGANPWVLTVASGSAKRREVKIGARGNGKVEILNGLEDGDLVVPSTDARVVEGQKVRAASQ
jgi:HlyD family secretion protein